MECGGVAIGNKGAALETPPVNVALTLIAGAPAAEIVLVLSL